VEWVFPAETADAARQSVPSERELTNEEMTRLRITDGIPAIPMDVGPGDLPNEGGLEAQAIS
jgi:tRNA-modifying protein YgfZ